MRKKVDSRIRTLVENGVKTRKRSIFVIIGDKGRDQVVNLHYMLSKAVVKSRPSVLWCYNKELQLSSHRKKRMKQLKKMAQRGLLDPEKDDPFSLFMASTNIRYCYYKETHNILGNTFGMCVLQDFEALTPNILARTIETVEGGGIIVILLSALTSLTKLYTMTMDVHNRFRTESHSSSSVVARFNERFTLSLAHCKSACVMDDQLSVLPLSTHIRNLLPVTVPQGEEALTESERDLRDLKESLRDTQPMGALVAQCKTLDQAKAVITFLDAISEKTLRSTVALTAARGRGKSAALGVAMAGAIALGYSNIFVTAPSPENLKTLFQFVCRGFDSMDYKEHTDYDLVESTNPKFNKAIVRVNVYRNHRQTIQYIQPQHCEKLAQAELLVIDEAAAIPLPVVKALLGPYLVFLCSTVNGYEGTGRSLSLKLIHQLREQAQQGTKDPGTSTETGAGSSRIFKEVQLAEPIRYAAGDPVEAWLNDLLCLEAATHLPKLTQRLPHPSECELFYVNRDTLFSYHKASELFLQRMMALYVASHYKNAPNDLQLMSDAPAHHLFVLLGPVDESQTTLPDILCVVQVCLEGSISKSTALRELSQGGQPTGDLIPWTVSQQYQDAQFPQLSGARIVRIATHPDLLRAGYGTRAVDLLRRYYEGELAPLREENEEEGEPEGKPDLEEAIEQASLLTEQITPRAHLPPLLTPLQERSPEPLHYLGVSFGLTQGLFNFWRSLQFTPLYVRQTPNEITGENTCICVRSLKNDDVDASANESAGWLEPFSNDFKRRFCTLLGFSFREFHPALSLSILDPKITFSEAETEEGVKVEGVTTGLNPILTPFDLKRLQSYADNLVDYHLILDLVPSVARLYFLKQIPVTLSYAQSAILVSLGLQFQQLASLESLLSLPSTQILALFNKAMRKIHGCLHRAMKDQIEATLPRVREFHFNLAATTVDEDLDEGAKQVKAVMKEKLATLLKPEELQKYALDGRENAFEEAIVRSGGKLPKSGLLSVKGERKTEVEENGDKKKEKSPSSKENGGKKRGQERVTKSEVKGKRVKKQAG